MAREFYLERHKAEFPTTLRVLKALPQDRLDYKPHERSPSAQQLFWTLANEMKTIVDAANTYRAEWKDVTPPPPAEMLKIFEQNANELTQIVGKMDDVAWNQKTQFFYQGQMVMEQPLGTFLWMVLFDSVHHRGQLAAYLRPMGGKVPSIYGPSADEKEPPAA